MLSTLAAAKKPSRAAKKRKHKTAAEDEVEYIGTHREYDDIDYEGPRTRGKHRRLVKKNRMRGQEGIKNEPQPRTNKQHKDGEFLCPVCGWKHCADFGCNMMKCTNESDHPDGQWVYFCGHCHTVSTNGGLTLNCDCESNFDSAARLRESVRPMEVFGSDDEEDDDLRNAFVSESSDMDSGRDSPAAPSGIALKTPNEGEGEATATNEGRTDLDSKPTSSVIEKPDIVSSAAYHEDTDTEENYSSQDVKLRGDLDDNQLRIKKEFNEDTDEETELGIFGADNSDEVQSKDDTLDDEDSLGLSTRDKSEGEQLPLSDEGRGKRKKKQGQQQAQDEKIDLTDVPMKEPILSNRRALQSIKESPSIKFVQGNRKTKRNFAYNPIQEILASKFIETFSCDTGGNKCTVNYVKQTRQVISIQAQEDILLTALKRPEIKIINDECWPQDDDKSKKCRFCKNYCPKNHGLKDKRICEDCSGMFFVTSGNDIIKVCSRCKHFFHWDTFVGKSGKTLNSVCPCKCNTKGMKTREAMEAGDKEEKFCFKAGTIRPSDGIVTLQCESDGNRCTVTYVNDTREVLSIEVPKGIVLKFIDGEEIKIKNIIKDPYWKNDDDKSEENDDDKSKENDDDKSKENDDDKSTECRFCRVKPAYKDYQVKNRICTHCAKKLFVSSDNVVFKLCVRNHQFYPWDSFIKPRGQVGSIHRRFC